MIRHNIDIACIQETNIPNSCSETRDSHTFIFSPDAPHDKEDWGVGFVTNEHVKSTAPTTYDAVLQHVQPKRTAAWEELQDTINKTTEAKNIICGDFNAALHHRKEGEEDVVGQHVFGKGRQFPETKEDRTPDNFVDNREHLITITRATNTVIANTFFQKNLEMRLPTKLWPRTTADRGPQKGTMK